MLRTVISTIFASAMFASTSFAQGPSAGGDVYIETAGSYFDPFIADVLSEDVIYRVGGSWAHDSGIYIAGSWLSADGADPESYQGSLGFSRAECLGPIGCHGEVRYYDTLYGEDGNVFWRLEAFGDLFGDLNWNAGFGQHSTDDEGWYTSLNYPVVFDEVWMLDLDAGLAWSSWNNQDADLATYGLAVRRTAENRFYVQGGFEGFSVLNSNWGADDQSAWMLRIGWVRGNE